MRVGSAHLHLASAMPLDRFVPLGRFMPLDHLMR